MWVRHPTQKLMACADILSRDKALFSFAQEDNQIHSLPNVLHAYTNVAPQVQLRYVS